MADRSSLLLLVAQDVDFSSVDELMGHNVTVALFSVGERDHVSCLADMSLLLLRAHQDVEFSSVGELVGHSGSVFCK